VTVAVHIDKVIQKFLFVGGDHVTIDEPPITLVECKRSFAVHDCVIGTVPA